MDKKSQKIDLLELIDKQFLQEFQDNFSKTTGLSCVTLDKDGFITEPSNFSDFCLFMKGNEKINKVCSKCDLEKRELGFKSKQPFTYTCHAGLTNFMVPIVLNNQTVALIVAGQTLTQELDEDLYKQLAKDFGINEKEYLKKVKKIKEIAPEKVESAKKLLSQVANSISNAAHQNYELQEKNKREKLVRSIIEKIRSSLNIEDTLTFICEETAKLLKVQRSTMIVFPDKKSFANFKLKKEYKLSESIDGYVKIKNLEDVSEYWGKMLSVNKIYAIDNILESDAPEFFKNSYSAMGVKSIIGIIIKDEKNIWGDLILSEYNKVRVWSDEEKEFLTTISQQIYIAITQAELYEKERKTAERETLLRKIISTIRESLNLEEIFNVICLEIHKIVNANRVAITEMVHNEENHIVRGEFKTDQCIKSAIDMDKADRIKVFDYLKSYIFNKNEPLIINNVEESNVPDFLKVFYKSLAVKSVAIFPIKKGEDDWGILTISHVADYKSWDEADIDFIEAIIEQIYIAINQAELYSKMQQQIEREKAILSNLPFMVWLKDINGKFLSVNEEFAKACDCKIDEIVGKTDYDFWSKELADGYVKDDMDVMQKRETKSLEELIQGPIGPRWHETYKTPIYNDKREVVGTTGFARDITERKEAQAELLLRQEKIIKSAKREKLLRKIIETVRSSLDLTAVKRDITKIIGQSFNADRCYFRAYDKKAEKFLAVDVEYLASDEVSSLLNVEPNQEELKFFTEEMEKQKQGFYPIVVNREFAKGAPVAKYFEQSNIVADYAIPIIDRQDELIWLVLHYTKEDPKLSEEDKKLLESIAYQIDIAFEQIRLYNSVKMQAHRETLLRKIIETIRKTLDVNETKKTIVTEVCKALDADIAYIVEYDPETNYPKSLDKYSEYRADENTQSLIGYDFSNAQVELLSSFHRQGQPAYMRNIEEFNKQNNINNTELEQWIKRGNIKSAIGMPMVYGGKIFGVLAVHYNKAEYPMDDEYIDFFKVISEQAGIAIYQAKLYEKIQLQAEREKISRNIIEILRSSIDKTIIKKLFVKNLGKFFNADRVFLSEYDAKTNTLLTIDNSSEYLSSESEKTSTSYDFTSSEFSETVEMLLEKREIKIEDFEEFIKQDSRLDERLISHYKEANTKSSYAFPITYQDQIMGAFAIQFTHQVVKLSEEDIGRIRSICTQAGIALYHANLYLKAQQYDFSKQSFMAKISEQIIKPTNEILDISVLLSQNEFEHSVEIEYLNKIITSCNHLLELTTELGEN